MKLKAVKLKQADGTEVEAFVPDTDGTPAPTPAPAPAGSGVDEAAIQRAVDAALAPFKAKMTNHMSGAPMGSEERFGSGIEVRGFASEKHKGLDFARYIKAMYRAKTEGETVLQAAKAMGYERVVKALNQTTGTAGGNIVFPEFSNELIEILSAVAVVRKAGATVVPMSSSSLNMGRQNGGATASYVGESVNIPKSEQTFDNVILTEKKLVALTPITNDLLLNASLQADQLVLRDLVRVAALREDLAFLRGDGTGNTPTGLRNLALAGNVFAGTFANAVTPTLAEIKKFIALLILKLRGANVPLEGLALFISPRIEQVLLAIVDGNGNAVYETEMLTRGTIRGIRYFVTTQIPENLVANTFSDNTEITLAAMPEILIGDRMAVQAEVFPNGTYHDGTALVSGISQDQSVVRLISKHDIKARHSESIAVGKDVRWA